MKYTRSLFILCFFIVTSTVYSCKKYLDAKPDKRLAVPTRLADYQALLDDADGYINSRGVTEIITSSDDYYFTDKDWTSQQEYNRNLYIWKRQGIFQQRTNSWTNVYTTIYYANTAITNIKEIARTSSNYSEWTNAMGQGLFIRANCFLQVASAWSLAYDQTTAKDDLGIPLRLNTDFNEPSKRSTLQETYDQIIKDVKGAIDLLPNSQPSVTRPNKAAAYGLLARTYLFMRNYQQAFDYADSSLQITNALMDYNQLDPTPYYPFPYSNVENLYYNHSQKTLPRIKIDSTLYASYDSDDLRKILYFKDLNDGSYGIRNNYDQNASYYMGIATDEMYLIKSECEARFGQVEQAMKDLNDLLITRWKTGTFVPLAATNQDDALNLILRERRKELVMRFARWMDVKRLNKEGRNITMKRFVNGKTYSLLPNSNGYALPIPEDVIQLSGMQQNPD